MLSQYEPLETLAPALFGHVQKWRHVRTGDYVAVKRMELRFAARKRCKGLEQVVEEDLVAEIKTNLLIQSLGGHPNVLPLRECIMEDTAVLLMLPYCHQGELLDVLNTKRAAGLSLPVRHYFLQTLQGAAFLHANGIAHRDLSLENVLVDDQECCYIMDFGLAVQCRGNLVVKPVGKLRYMAPELCAACTYQEDSSVDEYDPMAADVWALGVMLYAMVAARYPFREPLRKDDRFRSLEDFGVEYLLEKDEVDVREEKDVVELLKLLLVADPAKRPTLAELLSHLALPTEDHDFVATAKQMELHDAASSPTTVTSCQETRQPTWSIGHFTTGKGSLASVTPLSEVEKHKQVLACSSIKAPVGSVASTPVAGNVGGKLQCLGGGLLRKVFAAARA
uniref:Protein kinase domain-containing protein n=1 Tax=Peronospora matthiolae TaxID=2874970 RepID=A0AAV1U713_9STRA